MHRGLTQWVPNLVGWKDRGNDWQYFPEEGAPELSLNRQDTIQVKACLCSKGGLWVWGGGGQWKDGEEPGAKGDKRVQGPFKGL